MASWNLWAPPRGALGTSQDLGDAQKVQLRVLVDAPNRFIMYTLETMQYARPTVPHGGEPVPLPLGYWTPLGAPRPPAPMYIYIYIYICVYIYIFI